MFSVQLNNEEGEVVKPTFQDKGGQEIHSHIYE